MKKKILFALSTIACVLVTLSLAIFTIVAGTASTPSNNNNPNNNKPITIVDSDKADYKLYYIVGDVVDNDMLNNNYTQVKSTIISYDENKGAFVAVLPGKEAFQIVVDGNITTFAITVYDAGNGTQENPYNVISINQFLELVKLYNTTNTYFIQQQDFDLSGINWVPVGTIDNPFVANFNGNGKSINNLNITITQQNINYYVGYDSSYKTLYAGFFGVVNGSLIQNVTLNNAVIDTTAIEDEISLRTNNFDTVSVGTLVGLAYNSVINGQQATISSVVNSSVAGTDTGSVYTSVAGVAGTLYKSQIDNYNVNVNFNCANAGVVLNNVYYGTKIAGIAGRVENSTITGVNISMSAVANFYEQPYFCGIANAVYNKSLISDVNVNKFVVKLNKADSQRNLLAVVSGGVEWLDSTSLMQNCAVLNADVYNNDYSATSNLNYAEIYAQTSGIANINDGTIINCYVKGSLSGAYVGGIAYANFGTISYTNKFAYDKAVDVKIKARYYGAGVATYNMGNLTGESSKTEIKASIYWSVLNVGFLNDGEDIDTKYMLSGIVAANVGKVENFVTIVNIYDAVNASGAVGLAGGFSWGSQKYTTTTTINNVEVNTTVRTLKVVSGANYSGKTNVVAGVIAIANNNVSATNVISRITVNYQPNLLADKEYSLNIFGGLVGKMFSGVIVKFEGYNEAFSDVYSNKYTDSNLVDTIVGFNKGWFDGVKTVTVVYNFKLV